jgi:hypothetical protein
MRDSDGDLWAEDPDGGWRLQPDGGSYLPSLDILERVWGPLSEVTES